MLFEVVICIDRNRTMRSAEGNHSKTSCFYILEQHETLSAHNNTLAARFRLIKYTWNPSAHRQTH